MDERTQKILMQINDRGWNAYIQARGGRRLTPENTNRVGPVTQLEADIVYGLVLRGAKKQELSSAVIVIPHGVSGEVEYHTGSKDDNKLGDVSAFAGQRCEMGSFEISASGESVSIYDSNATREFRIRLEDAARVMESLPEARTE